MWYSILLICRIFLLEGGWWLSRTHVPNQTWLLPKNAVFR